MSAFLLTYNPAKSGPWFVDQVLGGDSGEAHGRWSTGTRNSGIAKGDRVYMLKQGHGPRGIIASGRALGPVEQQEHWDANRGGLANYIYIAWDQVIDEMELLPIDVLKSSVPNVHWAPQGSGESVKGDDEQVVELLWQTHITGLGRSTVSRKPNGWLLIAAGENRQFGGNDGYADDLSTSYRWDSNVPNATALEPGDIVVIWDKMVSLGASVIEEIDTDTGPKLVRRCPKCGKSSIKKRSTKKPLYRCQECGAEFDQAEEQIQQVTTYATRHDLGWVDLQGRLTGAELRALCESPGSQHAMRKLDLDAARNAIQEIRLDALGPLPRASRRVNGGFTQRITKVRKGQAEFRMRLLSKYGENCAFSGPTPEAALEAAHLYSYASVGEHEDDGGLLLRRDLHTLFDRGTIAVNPLTLELDLTHEARTFDAYAWLHETKLAVAATAKQRRWFAERWEEHREGTVD